MPIPQARCPSQKKKGLQPYEVRMYQDEASNPL
jgi:hypothetical protein